MGCHNLLVWGLPRHSQIVTAHFLAVWRCPQAPSMASWRSGASATPATWTPERRGMPRSTCGTSDFSTCRSEEHTSELQSRGHLVCRLLLEKKKKKNE